MKNILIKIIIIVSFCLLFPTALTLFINGKQSTTVPELKSSGRTIIITTDSKTYEMDMEEFIPCVLANQLDIDSPDEAIKAQAVIIRTYILYYMNDNTTIDASKLDLAYTLYDDLKNIVGDDFSTYYTKLKNAVADTGGEIIKYEDSIIIPYFHAISAGKTRNGEEALGSADYPYLLSKECADDTSSQDYLTITYIEKSDFVNILKEQCDDLQINEENPLENIQVLSRCSAGYVSSIQVGNCTFTGDEIQMYFSLKSPYFEFENFEDRIRIICKGNGHGLGLSIFGATQMAEKGSTYKDILSYYYTGVTIEK